MCLHLFVFELFSVVKIRQKLNYTSQDILIGYVQVKPTNRNDGHLEDFFIF
jgi:hypothetical protein